MISALKVPPPDLLILVTSWTAIAFNVRNMLPASDEEVMMVVNVNILRKYVFVLRRRRLVCLVDVE